MRKSFGLDVLACRDCGGRMEDVATLFSKNGLLARLRPGGYKAKVTATDPGFLESATRKFNFRVYEKRPV